jgi:hypothetical protein
VCVCVCFFLSCFGLQIKPLACNFDYSWHAKCQRSTEVGAKNMSLRGHCLDPCGIYTTLQPVWCVSPSENHAFSQFLSLKFQCQRVSDICQYFESSAWNWTVWGSNRSGIEVFSVLYICPDWPWGPPILLYSGHWVSLRVKQPGHGVDYLAPPSTQNRTGLHYTCIPPLHLHGILWGDLYTYRNRYCHQ